LLLDSVKHWDFAPSVIDKRQVARSPQVASKSLTALDTQLRGDDMDHVILYKALLLLVERFYRDQMFK